MNAAGYILTGMRKHRRRAHSPLILAHSLSSDFFGIEEREGWFPDFESFAVWPATARLLWPQCIIGTQISGMVGNIAESLGFQCIERCLSLKLAVM